MSDYLFNRVKMLKNICEELEAYFEGKQTRMPPEKDSSLGATFDFDFDSKSYILPDGMDPDAYMDLLSINENQLSYGYNAGNAALEIPGADQEQMPTLKEGSVTKRSDGRWMARYYDNGSRKSIYAASKNEAVEKLLLALEKRDADQKDSIVSKKMTLNDWVKKWIEIYKAPKLMKSSLDNINQTLVHYLKNDKLGKKEVSKLTPIDIEKFMNSIEKPSSRARTFAHLHECLDKLVRSKMVRENVCDLVDPVKRPAAKEKNVPDYETLTAFLNWLRDDDHQIYLFAKFLANSGLRRGEGLGLTWNDIDFDKNTIRVDKQFSQATKSVARTKTHSSIRTVPLLKDAKDVLDEISKTKKEIFSFISKTHITHQFTKKSKQYGLESTTLHILRHYFATQCLEAGVELKVLQKWMGHSKIDVLSNTYLHVNRQFENDQVVKMSKRGPKDD